MKKYILHRLLYLIPILLGITLFTFILLHSTNDIVDIMELNRGVVYSEATKTQIRQDLGLDQPIFIQYLNWLLSILSGNMGTSYLSGKDVSSLFFDKLPQTFYLTLSSILLTLLISLPLGILSAIKQNKIIDYIIRLFSFIGNSLPGFVVALILIYIFSVQLKLIPVLIDNNFIGLILPSIALALPMSAKYIRQIRIVVIEQLHQDYVRCAKARGLKLSTILIHSILKMITLPLLTLICLSIGSLLGGSAIIETIFRWDGVGKLAIDAINLRDYPIVLAYVFYLSLIYMFINLIADILYHYLDPRIKQQWKA